MPVINKVKFSVLEKNDSFKILICKGKKGEEMPLHSTDKPAFLLVLSGEILFDLNGTKSYLNKDRGISIPPGIIHSFQVIEDAEILLTLDAIAKIKKIK